MNDQNILLKTLRDQNDFFNFQILLMIMSICTWRKIKSCFVTSCVTCLIFCSYIFFVSNILGRGRFALFLNYWFRFVNYHNWLITFFFPPIQIRFRRLIPIHNKHTSQRWQLFLHNSKHVNHLTYKLLQHDWLPVRTVTDNKWSNNYTIHHYIQTRNSKLNIVWSTSTKQKIWKRNLKNDIVRFLKCAPIELSDDG